MDHAFQSYFNRFQDKAIRKYGALYVLQQLGIEHPEQGVYNNRAESVNAQFKRESKGISGLVQAVQASYVMSRDIVREIYKAYHRQGSMMLKPSVVERMQRLGPCKEFQDPTLKELQDALKAETKASMIKT
jgi:hypothetical protein